MLADAEHVVHVGEGDAARYRLLEMAGRERVIAALEVLPGEGDQLPQLVVHALPVESPARAYHGLPSGRREWRGERRIGSRGGLGGRPGRRRRSRRWDWRGGVAVGGAGSRR